MKMLLVVYSQAADYDVIANLKQAGVRCYTKMEGVRGEGTDTEPKLGTHTWPGGNNVLLIAVENEKVDQIMETIMQTQKEHPRAGVKTFIIPIVEWK